MRRPRRGHGQDTRVPERLPEDQRLLERDAGHDTAHPLELLQVARGGGLHPEKPDEKNPQDKVARRDKARALRRADRGYQEDGGKEREKPRDSGPAAVVRDKGQRADEAQPLVDRPELAHLRGVRQGSEAEGDVF